jgi:hypothetical protein
MFDKEKFIKIKPIYIYVISILVFSNAGLFYGNSKFNYSEFESIIVLGSIGGRNILPPQAVVEIVSKPALLNRDALTSCYGISANVGLQKTQANYQPVSESIGFLRFRSSDLNLLINYGEGCVYKIIESINDQEVTYVENGRYVEYAEKSDILRMKKTLNLTKFIGTPFLKEKPDLHKRNKYIILGVLFGLLVAYGLSNLLKRS